MKRFLLLLGCLFFLLISLFSQQPARWTSADMYLALRKLNVLGSVLYVAAHPDDENTRLIAYFSKDRMFRTGYLAMTRGDGGQNLIGDEQGIELGLIRTQELLSARRIDGGEQFFTRAFDFGYSKNPEETFTKWDREKILSDVVWVIRKFRPDVIITRFPTTGEGGHGHHTASAILANEAFAAAADPKRFPEQLRYVKPWQAKRIMWNTFRFGGLNTTDESQFKFDVGGYNPLLGKSYGEIAAESRSQHKSQGFGVPGSRGEAFEYFTLTGGTRPVKDLMDGVDLTWNRVPGGAAISKAVDAIAKDFDLFHPENSVKALVDLYQKMKELPDGYWRNKKMKETQELIEQCSGLFIEATTRDQFAVRSDSVRINFSINNRLGTDASVQEVMVDQYDTTMSEKLAKNINFNFSRTWYVPNDKPLTQPYWLEEGMQEGYYTVTDTLKIGQPDMDPAYLANISLRIYGEPFTYTTPVKYKYTDPVKGELYQPVFVIPAATLESSPSLVLFNNLEKQEKEVLVRVNANTDLPAPVRIELRTADSSMILKDPVPTRKFQSKTYSFTVNNFERAGQMTHADEGGYFKMLDSLYQNGKMADSLYSKLKAAGYPSDKKEFYYAFAHESDSADFYLALRAINYDHIPSIKYFFADVIKAQHLSLRTYNKKIGYIVGAGDKVPEALEQMGYEVTLLDERRLASNNLQQFDAIITGVRAYNTNEWLESHYDNLMKYVENGGNLVVQYNTSNFISSVGSKVGPYKFEISRNRVTNEKAEVRFLKPDHPVLNFPNKINESDFSNWIQERSIYDANNWDPHFETILSMHDPGEKSDEGSLIIARYGKGVFVYTGLVFFRELPAGIPGAYRLLANIIALNRKKGF